MSAPTLAELQRGFFRSIAARPGAGRDAFDPAVLAVIAPSATLAPAERLGIYADMYFARLQDCLREDFSRTVELMGDDAWDGFARAFLAAHPSRYPSVRHVGTPLAAFLASHPPAGVAVDAVPALSELARFEWARLDVFDSPDAEPLTGADLAAVPADDWGALRFRPIPAFAMFTSAFPVHRLWTPDAPLDPSPAPTVLRLWRQDFKVFHSPMDPTEVAAMTQLVAGAPFASICEAIADGTSMEEAAPKAVGWLARWIEDGILGSLAGPLAL